MEQWRGHRLLTPWNFEPRWRAEDTSKFRDCLAGRTLEA
jgi:hypothetical protein